MVLELIHGMVMNPVFKYLLFARRIMVTILKRNDLPKITLPALEKLDAYGATIQVLHPTLDNVWDMKDRINCPIEKALLVKLYNPGFIMTGSQIIT